MMPFFSVPHYQQSQIERRESTVETDTASLKHHVIPSLSLISLLSLRALKTDREAGLKIENDMESGRLRETTSNNKV